jgi:hypothetical protein
MLNSLGMSFIFNDFSNIKYNLNSITQRINKEEVSFKMGYALLFNKIFILFSALLKKIKFSVFDTIIKFESDLFKSFAF